MAYVTPHFLADRFARLAGYLTYLFSTKTRQIVLRNLEHIFHDRSLDKYLRDFYARKTFENYARCLFDFFRLAFISQSELISSVKLTGFENCAGAIQYNRGCVMITMHLGNWDYAGSYLAVRGVPMSALAEELKPGMFKLYTRNRERTGMKTYPLAKTVNAFLDTIKKNRILAILVDRDITKTGIAVRIFSGKRNIPRGLGSIIARRKMPVLFAYLVLNPTGRHHRYLGFVETPIFFASEEDFNIFIVRKMEETIIKYPDQWFALQPDWIA